MVVMIVVSHNDSIFVYQLVIQIISHRSNIFFFVFLHFFRNCFLNDLFSIDWYLHWHLQTPRYFLLSINISHHGNLNCYEFVFTDLIILLLLKTSVYPLFLNYKMTLVLQCLPTLMIYCQSHN